MSRAIAVIPELAKVRVPVERCEKLEPVPTAVVHPCEGDGVIRAVSRAANHGPHFDSVGPDKILSTALSAD
jgi:hypothetical protein